MSSPLIRQDWLPCHDWHWVLRRAPQSAILVASNISWEVGRFSHWVCLRPDHLGKHCSLRKGSHEFPQLAISFEAVQKLAYLKNQIAKIRMTQSGKAEVWTCTKCSWLPLFVVHKIMFDSVDQYLTPNPRKTIAENQEFQPRIRFSRNEGIL